MHEGVWEVDEEWLCFVLPDKVDRCVGEPLAEACLGIHIPYGTYDLVAL